MNLKEKLPIAQRAIESIATHDDEDAAVVRHALDQVIAMCEAAKRRIDERVAARAAELTGH